MGGIARFVACVFSTVAFAVTATLLLERAAGELAVFWYMHTYDIALRSDLAEDYGFGLLGLGVSLGTIALTFPLASYFAWGAVRGSLRSRGVAP